MKKIFLVLIGTLLLTRICHAQIEVKVDERFELTSIIFALAGVPEYCQSGVPSYFQDIIKEFTPYELTKPVNFVRELNQVHQIGYNAVPATACLLEIKDENIVLQSQYDISKISEIAPRWTENLFAEYIKILNLFYKESNFHKFFEDHRELYKIAEQRMNKHVENTATEWFQSFFGKSFDPDIKAYISLANGPNNYAMSEGVLIGMMNDSDGQPAPNSETSSLLIHEISHHYTNPIFFHYWKEMEEAAHKIYPAIKDKMWKIGYGDARAAMCEWLNNLFVLMYSKETKNELLQADIAQNIKKGFIWMQRSVDFMENFYANRNHYSRIEDFMPQLVSFLNFTAENFELVEREYNFSQPYITNIYPAPGSDITDADEIIITFSEPMLGSSGFDIIQENGVEVLWFDSLEWNNNGLQVKLKLIPHKREPNHTYGIGLKPEWFISKRYFYLYDLSKNLIFKAKHQ